MTALQAAALGFAVIAGTVVALLADPLRQALSLGIYGFALSLLFFVFQAPDAALSEIVVSGVALPVIVLAALRKLGQQEQEQAAARSGGGDQERDQR